MKEMDMYWFASIIGGVQYAFTIEMPLKLLLVMQRLYAISLDMMVVSKYL